MKPKVFVTYRAEEELKTSPVASESTDPTWEWTSTFRKAPSRKNLVLKFWHRSGARGDRVLGFVSLDLVQFPTGQVTSGSYDLVDLSQSSTGRVQLTVKRFNDSDAPPPLDASFSHHFQPISIDTETEPVGTKRKNYYPGLPNGENVGRFTASPNEISPLSRRERFEEEESLRASSDSLRRLEPVSGGSVECPLSDDKGVNTSGVWVRAKEGSRMENYMEMASKSFLAEKIRTDMKELSDMMARLNSVPRKYTGAALLADGTQFWQCS